MPRPALEQKRSEKGALWSSLSHHPRVAESALPGRNAATVFLQSGQ
jgi:hypothetical protein